MISFFIIATIILCTIHTYLYVKLRPLFNSHTWHIGLLVLFIIMFGLLIFQRRGFYESLPDIIPVLAYSWLGFIMICFVCFLSVDLIRLLLFTVKGLSGFNAPALLPPRHTTPILLVVAVVISVYSYFSAQNVQVNHVSVPTEKLAANAQKIRIVAMTDIHLGHTVKAKHLAKFLNIVKEQKPDIVVIVGDIIDADMEERHEDAALLRALPAPGGCFTVHGNHEVYSGLDNARRFISRAGLVLLENKATSSLGINIVGINDPTLARMGYAPKSDAVELLKQANPKYFTLLLKHQPIIDDEEIGLFDLQISGHTHGGQIWPAGYITQKVFGFKQGLTVLENDNGKSTLYLSNGTGYWGPPMRLLAPPEITVFDIVPASDVMYDSELANIAMLD